MKSPREPYASDLTELQWTQVRELIPPPRRLGRTRSTDMREVLNAINYRWETGCVWRNLPKGFPPWATIYTYYRQWEKDGLTESLRQAIQAGASPSRPASDAKTQTTHPLNPAKV